MPITPVTANPGLAEFQSDTIGGGVELLAGDTPAIVTFSASYTAAQAAAGIPMNTPVDVDYETGVITYPLAEGAKPNAITLGTLRAGTGGGAAGRMAVYKAGCFNINALNWPASLATEAARLAAFDLASSQIYVKKPYYS